MLEHQNPEPCAARLQRSFARASGSATPGAGAGVSISLGGQPQAANPFARASAPARASGAGGGGRGTGFIGATGGAGGVGTIGGGESDADGSAGVSAGGGSPPAGAGGGGAMQSLPPDVRARLGEDTLQQEVLQMDDPEAEQPLGFRRASAGANLPSGVQAVGMEVCFDECRARFRQILCFQS